MPPDPNLDDLTAALRGLQPSPGRVDRDRIVFAAGRAEGLRAAGTGRGWRLAAAALAVIATGEGAALMRPSTVPSPEQVVIVYHDGPVLTPAPAVIPDPIPAPPPDLPPRTDRDRLADQVIRYGLDGLPPSPRWIARDQPGTGSVRPGFRSFPALPELGDPTG